jgi:NSS family neurotransmitter:Na+ symporter
MKKERSHWSGNTALILVAAGSAIGLGNIWKFPYIAGINGGGAFVLVYLICIAFIGLPILIAEMAVGRESQSDVISAFSVLRDKKSKWVSIGWLGVISAFLILSFYSVVGGWILDFEVKSIMMKFTTVEDAEIKNYLGQLFGSPVTLVFWHTVFMALTVGIVLKGVTNGIEKASKILMPILMLILVGLLIRVMFLNGFSEAANFLFAPDFSKLTWEGTLEAVGHSFFTLSLGMGAMLTYGSYIGKSQPLVRSAVAIGLLDTVIALVAGLIIFSVVFSFGGEPQAGPTLMFVTLPLLFKKIAGGSIIAILFFMLIAFAALTSAISLLEVVVSALESKKGWTRKKGTLLSGVVIWALGILCALSFNVLADFKPLLGMNIFDLFDTLTGKVFLPLGGLLIAIFFGWSWKSGPESITELTGANRSILVWSNRIIAPIAIAYVLFNGLKHFFS